MRVKDTVTDYKVISTIRFIAMCSVVWGHCSLASETKEFTHMPDIVLQSVVLQLGRLGTIMFLIISGFLLQPQISRYTIFTFLKERFASTILPWIIFVLLFAGLQLYNNQPLRASIINGGSLHLAAGFTALIKNSVFYFAYWFIVVFVISTVLLIALKKYINTRWLGVVLGLITLFYCINLYYGWITTHHTKAFLGYAFFMWLGVQIRMHYSAFVTKMQNLKWSVLAGAFVLSFAIACYETIILRKIGSGDPYASIRLTNIIASLITFCCLFKAGSSAWVNQNNLRHDIYGVYLIHSILIYQFGILLAPYFDNLHAIRSQLSLLNAQILFFVAIMTVSLLLVKAYKQMGHSLVEWWQMNGFKFTPSLKSNFNLLGNAKYGGVLAISNIARFAAIIIIPSAAAFIWLAN